jgi:hypothetical protein
MSPIFAALLAPLLFAAPTGPRLYSIPTSEEVRVASMAARDEGYSIDNEGTFLDEMRTPDGKQPHLGYLTIVLYSDGDLIHSYSIRIQTGDVVDAHTCQLFAYPDLLKFRQKLTTNFGTEPVSPSQIAEEVGCAKIDVVHSAPRAQVSRHPRQ